MPPEPLPWDRKERKIERASSDNLGSSRWREPPPSNRWGSADFRRPSPGYDKQSGWHVFSEYSFHGSGGSSRSNDEERYRSYGRYGRSSGRESRGVPEPFSRRDWRGQSWDAAVSAPPMNGSVRMPGDVNERRAVDGMPRYKAHNCSDNGRSLDQLQLKDQNGRKDGGVNDLGTGQRFEGNSSLSSIDWKPMKWTRSGSLSSGGSDFSHSSSSKSTGVDSGETKVEVIPQNVPPLQSPCGNGATACTTSTALSEETGSRKKARLGWGEGLAKFEKKNVNVPDDNAEYNGVILCESNIEPLHCEISNVLDRSPRVNGSLDCASPATPSSVACNSSPGVEDNTSVKMVNVGNANLCSSPCAESQEPSAGLSFNLENLEMTTADSLGSSISELLQYGNQSSVDSDFVKFTALNKVLVLKADISKKLEVTESEIDSLENELKSLISETSTACQCPASSSSLPRMPSETPGDVSSLIPRPATLELQSSDDMIMDPACDALVEIAESRDEEIDSPGTATSKFSDAPLRKEEYEDDIVKYDEYLGNVVKNGTTNIELKSSVFADSEESKDATSGKYFADSSCHIPSTDVGVNRENVLCDLIMASNKESAYIASAELNKSLPVNLSCIGSLRVENIPSCEISLVVKKFAMRRRFLMFKERVTTLKFRAFQHLWKEDLRLLSMRRCCAKSQKKFELSLRMPYTGCQKHRSSSVHSRFSSPAGNLSLVPTTEVINFASKLLVDCHVKMYRSNLKMPALILDKKEMVISRFISTNGLVEDPCAAEKGRCMINPWTSIEKEIFLDKFTIFGKDFRKIACFLDHKTTADCVEFYYKNHKSDFFQKAKKQPEFGKQRKSNSTSTYLVTSGKRWNRNNSAVSLDILGVASEIAANVDDGLKGYQKCATRVSVGTSNNCKTTRGNTGMLERASSPVAMANERETLAADVLAGICNSFSSEAMSSCITSSVDFGEGNQERKGKMLGNSGMRPLTPEVDDETCSDESCGEMDPANWTDEEKSTFIQAVTSYGKDFTKISRCVRTRSSDQCKVFFSKARKCFGLDVMQPRPCSDGAAASDEYNGGGSDTEDACVVEDGSVICHKESGSKKDEDIPPSNIEVSRDRTYIAGTIHVDPEPDQLEEDNRDGELNVKATEFRPENATSDECSDDKLDLNLESISNTDNCAGKDSLSVDISREELAITDTEFVKNQATERTLVESVVGLEGNDDGKSSVSVACAEVKSEGEIYTDNSGVENTGYELLLGRSSLNEKRVGIVDINMNDLSGVNCSVQGTRMLPLLSENSSASVDTDSFGIGAPTVYKHRNMMNSDPVQKALVGSLNDCNDYMPTSGLLQDAAALLNGKNLTHDLGLNIHSQNLTNQQFQNSAITDDCQKCMCERYSIDQLDPPKIFKDYPVPMSIKNQTNGDIVFNKPGLQAMPDVDRSYLSGQFLPKDLHLEKCKSSLSQDPMQDPSKKSKPQCSSDSDKPTRKGDVKLFGQILSHPPTQHNPNYKVQERDDRGSQHPKLSDNSFNLKLTGNQKLDGILASAKFELNNSLALDNLPVRRSFGFWDGNRIQTGFPSLPDSAILLAKYPAAFSNYPMASSRIEKQQIHSSIVSNDCNLNGTAVFPTRDINGSKGAAHFPAYESRDVIKLQPYTVDLKQHQDMFLSETHIRGNDFDATSSLQQRARGMVGINVGKGGILLSGGPCTVVSDPVAALKMHYAKTEQYAAQAGSILRDGEMWRSTGDLGR